MTPGPGRPGLRGPWEEEGGRGGGSLRGGGRSHRAAGRPRWGLPLFTTSQWAFPSSLDPQHPERIYGAARGATVLWAPGPQGPLVAPQASPREGLKLGEWSPARGRVK